MKIRNGFVSNSSSSSFLIYGVCLDNSGLVELANKLGIETESDGYDLAEEIVDKIGKGIDYHHPPDDDYFYIGRSWDAIGDNQTGAEFKKEIDELLGGDCSTFSEAWYDG